MAKHVRKGKCGQLTAGTGNALGLSVHCGLRRWERTPASCPCNSRGKDSSPSPAESRNRSSACTRCTAPPCRRRSAKNIGSRRRHITSNHIRSVRVTQVPREWLCSATLVKLQAACVFILFGKHVERDMIGGRKRGDGGLETSPSPLPSGELFRLHT